MSLRFYMDVHVHNAITLGLRERGIDVLTAQEDGMRRLPDPALLDRSTELGRMLFSQDQHLLVEAAHRQRTGKHFAGLAYAHPLSMSIGNMIFKLQLLSDTYEPADMVNRVEYLSTF